MTALPPPARRWLAALRRRAQSAMGGAVALPTPPPPAALLDDRFLRQLETLSLGTRRAATSGLAGDHPSRRRASSVDFADYRRYVPGDDFRLIDWNVYARLGELCLKLTQARENVTLHLLIDASASMGWGCPTKLLYAQRAAAALGCLALASYDTVLLTVLQGSQARSFPLLRGRGALPQLLAYLGEVQPLGATDLRASVAAFCQRGGRSGVAVLLSDLWVTSEMSAGTLSTATTDALAYLRRIGLVPTVLHVLDAQEVTPTLDGAVSLVDVETGQQVDITITPTVLAAYAQQVHAYQDDLRATCLRAGTPYLPVLTDTPLSTLVLQELRQLAIVV